MSTLTARAEADLVSPHAGTLVDRIVPRAEAAALERRATGLPSLTLDARELADLELIATGAASPLTGFLGAADYASVLLHLRLADGTVWPLPFTLAVEEAVGASLKPGDAAALRDPDGRLWGVIDVREIFERDPRLEARKVYRTEDPSHPGVAYLLARPRWLVAGPVTVLPLPEDLPFAAHRLTPRALRARIAERGWQRVAGFQTRNPIHRAHEHLTKLALEFADGLVIHPLVGETKNDDVPAAVRFRAYETLVETYYPPDRTLLAAHLPPRPGEPARALGDEGAGDPAGGRAPAPEVHPARDRGDPARALRGPSPGAAGGPASLRRLHPLVHGPLGRGQEHPRPGRARAPLGRAVGGDPRRRRGAHLPLEGPRLLEGGPRHQHPAHRLRGATPGQERGGRDHRRHLALRRHPRRGPAAGRGGGHPVRGSVRLGRPRRPGRPRRQGALQEGAGRRGAALHRGLRSLRAALDPGGGGADGPRERGREPGPGPRRARGKRAARGRAARGGRGVSGAGEAVPVVPVFPVFLKLAGRRVLLVGGGPVASGKLAGLLGAGAHVTVVAPKIRPEIEAAEVTVLPRPFEPSDLDGAWLVVAAATPEVNREVAAAAEERHVFVNAVDDPGAASAYTGGVFRRDGVTRSE